MPKYLGYFERILRGRGESGGGARRRAADLRRPVAVPDRARAAVRVPEARWPRWRRTSAAVLALAERVERRPNIAAYLASARRIAFNEQGIFRHYPELDG